MIVVLVISIGFLVPKAAAPQSEVVTKIMHSGRGSPSTGEGTRQRARSNFSGVIEGRPVLAYSSLNRVAAVGARHRSWHAASAMNDGAELAPQDLQVVFWYEVHQGVLFALAKTIGW